MEEQEWKVRMEDASRKAQEPGNTEDGGLRGTAADRLADIGTAYVSGYRFGERAVHFQDSRMADQPGNGEGNGTSQRAWDVFASSGRIGDYLNYRKTTGESWF